MCTHVPSEHNIAQHGEYSFEFLLERVKLRAVAQHSSITIRLPLQKRQVIYLMTRSLCTQTQAIWQFLNCKGMAHTRQSSEELACQSSSSWFKTAQTWTWEKGLKCAYARCFYYDGITCLSLNYKSSLELYTFRKVCSNLPATKKIIIHDIEGNRAL